MPGHNQIRAFYNLKIEQIFYFQSLFPVYNPAMPRKSFVVLALILIVTTLLGSSMLTRGHTWGDDFAAYIGQAQSIVRSDMDNFVRRNAFTVTQSSHEPGHQMGPAAYPWGFPLLLAPVYAFMGISPLGMKVPGLLTYLGFLLAFFLWTKTRFTPIESLLAVSLFGFNPGLLLALDSIGSDIPFLFLSTLAILVADRYTRADDLRRRQILSALTGVSIFAAAFVRTQGLLLLGAVLLWQGIRFLTWRETRRQTVIEALITVAGFGVLWGAAALVFPGGQTSYLSLYEDFSMSIVYRNISLYLLLFGDFFAGLPGSTFIFGLFVVLFFIGLVARWKDDLLVTFYAGLYLLVLWSWPEWQGYRMIFPLLPVFIYFAFWGTKVLLRLERGKEIAQKFVSAFLLLMVATFVVQAGLNAYGNLRAGREINGPFDSYSMEMYDFIKEQTPPKSVIVFFKPRALRLMTDHDALALTECARLPEGDYLALSKKVGENLQIPPEDIGECNLPLNKVFENRRFVVYRVEK
jgi:hypothetical protein